LKKSQIGEKGEKEMKFHKTLLFFLIFSLLIFPFFISGSSGADYPPSFSQTDTRYILSNGKLRLEFSKNRSWVTSFKYDNFEILPTDFGIGEDRWQIYLEHDNGSVWNYYTFVSYSYEVNETESYVKIQFNMKASGWTANLTATEGNFTYILYPDKLLYKPSIRLNWTETGNHTIRNRLGTNYQQWDSMFIYGGYTAFNKVFQFNYVTANATFPVTYNWGYEYLGNNCSLQTFGRSMSFPLMVFVKSNLEMTFYLEELEKQTFWVLWKGGETKFRTDFGNTINEYQDINATMERTYVFEFTELTPAISWSDAVKDYIDGVASKNNWTTKTTVKNSLKTQNMMDMWPAQWGNESFFENCKKIKANILWFYGWFRDDETYPFDGNWTTFGDKLPCNVTYLRDTITNLQNEGFEVYLYMRCVANYNKTVGEHPEWLSKKNPTEYYWHWDLDNGEKTVKYAFSNTSFQAYYINLTKALYDFYKPDGIAYDCGGSCVVAYDVGDWGSGNYYLGLINVYMNISMSGIPIIGNNGVDLTSLFCDGMLFENPKFNQYSHAEITMSHMYHATAWMLTTDDLDQTVENQTMWTRFSLASGINRAFNFNDESIWNSSLQSFIVTNYNLFWKTINSKKLTPSFWTDYPINNNLMLGSKTWVAYLRGKKDLWLIIFRNNTDSNIQISVYSPYSKKSYDISGIFDKRKLERIKIEYTISVNILNKTLTDLYLYKFLDSWLDLYFMFGVGMVGLFMMVFAPTWVAFGLRRNVFQPDKIERIGKAVLIFIIGFGLFISWLWA